MVDFSARIVGSSIFKNFITSVIILTGIIAGVETDPEFSREHASILSWLNGIVLAIFTVEIALKMIAHGSRPWLFFKDPWNIFDFVIVVASLVPTDSGQFIVVFRLLRLLRVMRLVRALPALQILVTALLRSIPSMGYIALFLFLLFYVYGIAGVFLFSANDPIHFKDLPNALLSLFRVATLEDWTDVMYIQMKGCAGYEYYAGNNYSHLCTKSQAYPIVSPIYFVTFVLMGTMVIMNLFIGVIMTGMEQAHDEVERAKQEARMKRHMADEGMSLEDELASLRERMMETARQLETVERIARGRTKGDGGG